MSLLVENIADVVTATLKDLGPLKWTDIMSALQDHVVMNFLLKKHKVGFSSGYALQWNVGVATNNAARMVPLYNTDALNAADGLKTATIGWKWFNTNYSIDEREVLVNREPARILNLLLVARAQGMTALAELLETQFLGIPAGASDDLTVNGLQYWIVPSVTQGFNGGNPFGFTAGAGGLSSTTYPNWANYTDAYVDATKQDMVRRMRRAAVFTRFKSPVMPATIPSYSTGDKRAILTTYFVYGRAQEIMEQQNDDLGKDIAPYDDDPGGSGDPHFRRIPIMWVPKFESIMGTVPFVNATYASSGMAPMNPIYGVNFGVFRPVFVEGFYLKEYGPYRAPMNHNVLLTQVDGGVNLECRNRRENWVLTQ